MKELIQFIGISPKRLRVEWIATSEANKFSKVVSDFTEEIIQMGPSPLRFKKKGKFEVGQKGMGTIGVQP